MKSKLVLILFVLSMLISGGYAASGGKNLKGTVNPMAISVEALNGPVITDLLIRVTPDIAVAKKIQVKAYYPDGSLKFTRNYADISPVNSLIQIQFTDLLPEESVHVRVQTDQGGVFESGAPVLLRPDLIISRIKAASEILVNEPLYVNVTIAELNGDSGAQASVVLMNGETVLDAVNVTTGAGGTVEAQLSAVFTTRGDRSLGVRIMNTVPSEYNDANNTYAPLPVKAVGSDLEVTGVAAPVNVSLGEVFEVAASISELYGEVETKAAVALLENGTVLSSKSVIMPAGGSGTVYLNGSLDGVGIHNIAVRILNSVPVDNNPANNEQSFIINVKKPLEPVAFISKYSSRNVSVNTTHSVSSTGYTDNSEESEQNEDETLVFKASSSRSLSFPVSRVYFNVSSETGNGYAYEETGVTPTNGSTFTKYYPDSNVSLTLTVDSSGTTMSIESTAGSSSRHSRGYLAWWFKSPEQWDVTTSDGSGKLIKARENLYVHIEIEDASIILGGSAVTGISTAGETGGWADSTEGRFEQRRSAYVYSGNNSGVTVI